MGECNVPGELRGLREYESPATLRSGTPVIKGPSPQRFAQAHHQVVRRAGPSIMSGGLGLVVLLLMAAVLVVVVFRLLHLPALIGYLLIGIAVGPSGFGLATSTRESQYLAEFGVVFLMFTIGLEFSLPRLFQMRRVVLGLGGLQVSITIALITLLCAAAGYGWKVGFALGGIFAMSSTAIVIRLLADRRELDSPHGKEAFGVLLFQDLAVVPLLIIIPALGGDEGQLLPQIGWAAVKAVVVLAVILFVGQRLMRGWFHLVAARRSKPAPTRCGVAPVG